MQELNIEFIFQKMWKNLHAQKISKIYELSNDQTLLPSLKNTGRVITSVKNRFRKPESHANRPVITRYAIVAFSMNFVCHLITSSYTPDTHKHIIKLFSKITAVDLRKLSLECVFCASFSFFHSHNKFWHFVFRQSILIIQSVKFVKRESKKKELRIICSEYFLFAEYCVCHK